MTDIKYTKDHEWVKMEGSDVAVIGITEYAQHALGDLVFIELPKTGASYKKGAHFAVVESVKAAFDIYSPVSGKITKVNGDLSKNPALVNQSPYDNGWLFTIQKANADDEKSLMTHQAYQTSLTEDH